MDIIDPCSEFLSNYQVLNLLKTNDLSGGARKLTNLATITYETISYLETTPAASSSSASISQFLDSLKEKKYELSKLEKVQLVNLCPKDEAELNTIVDNLEEKFTEEQRGDILNLVNNITNQKVIVKEEEKAAKKIKL